VASSNNFSPSANLTKSKNDFSHWIRNRDDIDILIKSNLCSQKKYLSPDIGGMQYCISITAVCLHSRIIILTSNIYNCLTLQYVLWYSSCFYYSLSLVDAVHIGIGNSYFPPLLWEVERSLPVSHNISTTICLILVIQSRVRKKLAHQPPVQENENTENCSSKTRTNIYGLRC